MTDILTYQSHSAQPINGSPVLATSSAQPAALDRTDMSRWLRLIIFATAIFLIIGLVALAIHLLTSIHHTVLLFALGGLVAYALDPLVERLRHPLHGSKAASADANAATMSPGAADASAREDGADNKGKGLSRKASVAIVFLTIVIVLGVAIWLLGSEIGSQVKVLRADFPEYHARALALAGHIDTQLAARHIRFSLQNSLTKPPPEVSAWLANTGKALVPLLAHTFSSVGESIIVLLIALYFLLFGPELKVSINKNLPGDLLQHVIPWQTDVNRILGGFVRGQLIIALVTGAAAALGLLLIGVHLWLIIGLFVVVAALIPVFGPYLGAIPAIIAALIGPTHIHSPAASAIAVLVLFIIINESGSKILYPKLVGQALGLHEVLVLFVLFAGLEIDGIIGTLFAAPIAALAIVTTVHLYRYWQGLADNVLANVAQTAGKKAEKRTLA